MNYQRMGRPITVATALRQVLIDAGFKPGRIALTRPEDYHRIVRGLRQQMAPRTDHTGRVWHCTYFN